MRRNRFFSRYITASLLPPSPVFQPEEEVLVKQKQEQVYMIESLSDPNPDEILYSVWARFSDCANYPNLSDVFEELFGKSKLKPIVDLPCHLGYFFDQLPFGHGYSLDLLIDRHTLLPFYAPFLPTERYKQLREQMIQGHGKAVQRRAGSVGPHVPQPVWLRYCPVCVELDRAKFGECYWHRLHQIPGVEVCPMHAVFLENSSVRSQSTFSKKKFSSAERTIKGTAARTAKGSPFYTLLRDIALDAAYLLDRPASSLGENLLQRQYLALLARSNFLTRGGMLRCIEFAKAFTDYYPKEFLKLLNCEVHYASRERTWLTSLTHRPKRERHANRSGHPLHHLLALRFLGVTVKEFFNQEFQLPSLFGEGPWPCLNPTCQHYRQCCIRTCQINELKNEHYQGIFVCDCGFTYSRYMQSGLAFSFDTNFEKRAVLSYGTIWETRLRELWFDQTVSLKEISRRLGMSEVGLKWHAIELHLPLTRVISRTMASSSQTVNIEQNCSWYRNRWLEKLKEHPEENIGKLQERTPLVYKWLLHNDRQWLNAHLQSRKIQGGLKIC